jgi:hypothetical protein
VFGSTALFSASIHIQWVSEASFQFLLLISFLPVFGRPCHLLRSCRMQMSTLVTRKKSSSTRMPHPTLLTVRMMMMSTRGVKTRQEEPSVFFNRLSLSSLRHPSHPLSFVAPSIHVGSRASIHSTIFTESTRCMARHQTTPKPDRSKLGPNLQSQLHGDLHSDLSLATSHPVLDLRLLCWKGRRSS